MKKTKTQLFLELALPNEEGFSRWVSVDEFTGEYFALQLGNGGSWCRRESQLARKYKVEFDRSKTRGNSINAIRLAGFNFGLQFNQNIRLDIKLKLKRKKCVMLGVSGNSENVIIEIDHKDGRKGDERLNELANQKEEDFQPLCKAANTIKRQICKICKKTNIRWDARNIKGNPYSFYEGDEQYNNIQGCRGCYQYDPVEYRRTTTKKIATEATKVAVDYLLKTLYPSEEED